VNHPVYTIRKTFKRLLEMKQGFVSKVQILIFFPAFPAGSRCFFLLMNILNLEIHLPPPPAGFGVFETLPACLIPLRNNLSLKIDLQISLTLALTLNQNSNPKPKP